MPVLCFGPVCIPCNLLLPFLLGIAHRYGWLKWIKREWLTFTWWKQQFSRSKEQPAAECSSSHCTTAGQAGTDPRYVCEGDVCRLVQPDGPQAESTKQQAAAAEGGSTTMSANAAGDGGGSRVRHRRA